VHTEICCAVIDGRGFQLGLGQ